MRHINFSDVGVIINTPEELDELYLTYTALGIPFSDRFEEDSEKAKQYGLIDWFVQSATANIGTNYSEEEFLTILKYPIKYTLEIYEYAIACQLLNSNQEDELIAYLDKYCKEYE